jgi:hypothetical protein
MGVIMTGQNVMDFGLDLAHAIDAERLDSQTCCNMNLEDARVSPDVQAELQARGHRLVREGEYAARPIVQAAGTDPENGERLAVSDPRGESGSNGQKESGADQQGFAAAALLALCLFTALQRGRHQRRRLGLVPPADVS